MTPLTDGAIVRRRASDARIFGAAGYALLLQVGHPTIAAGVRDHSRYQTDPWGRFFGTLDYLTLLIYGTPEQVDVVGRRLRQMHAAIRGRDPSGRAYSALEPSAFAWVHATLADALVRGHQLFGTPFTAGEREQLWSEWRDLGAIIGVGEGDLPPTWARYQEYRRDMVHGVLQDSDVVQSVMAKAADAYGGTPFAFLSERVWAVAGRPLGRCGAFLTAGTLGSQLRHLYDVPWSPPRERLFRAFAAASRASTPLLPGPARKVGPMLLKVRSREIARGDFVDPQPVAAAARG